MSAHTIQSATPFRRFFVTFCVLQSSFVWSCSIKHTIRHTSVTLFVPSALASCFGSAPVKLNVCTTKTVRHSIRHLVVTAVPVAVVGRLFLWLQTNNSSHVRHSFRLCRCGVSTWLIYTGRRRDRDKRVTNVSRCRGLMPHVQMHGVVTAYTCNDQGEYRDVEQVISGRVV